MGFMCRSGQQTVLKMSALIFKTNRTPLLGAFLSVNFIAATAVAADLDDALAVELSGLIIYYYLLSHSVSSFFVPLVCSL
jgi:hypothetical protein